MLSAGAASLSARSDHLTERTSRLHVYVQLQSCRLAPNIAVASADIAVPLTVHSRASNDEPIGKKRPLALSTYACIIRR